MELAVRFYGDLPNPLNVPSEWPRDAVEIETGSPLPAGFAHRFTVPGLENWKSARQSLFDAWLATHETVVTRDLVPQAVFYTANSAVETDTTKVLIPFNTAMKTSPLFALQCDGSVLLTEDALVEVSADVTAFASKTGSSTNVAVWIDVDGVPVSGTLAQLLLPTKDLGVSLRTFGVVDLLQGQRISISLQRVKGSAAIKTIPNGCRIRIRKE